jgi:hypothetical protein
VILNGIIVFNPHRYCSNTWTGEGVSVKSVHHVMNSMQLLLAYYSTFPGIQPRILANPTGGNSSDEYDSTGRVFLDLPVAYASSLASKNSFYLYVLVLLFI